MLALIGTRRCGPRLVRVTPNMLKASSSRPGRALLSTTTGSDSASETNELPSIQRVTVFGAGKPWPGVPGPAPGGPLTSALLIARATPRPDGSWHRSGCCSAWCKGRLSFPSVYCGRAPSASGIPGHRVLISALDANKADSEATGRSDGRLGLGHCERPQDH